MASFCADVEKATSVKEIWRTQPLETLAHSARPEVWNSSQIVFVSLGADPTGHVCVWFREKVCQFVRRCVDADYKQTSLIMS